MSVHFLVMAGEFWYASVLVGNGNLSFADVMRTFLGVLYAGMSAMCKSSSFSKRIPAKTGAAILRCKPLLRTSLRYISEFFWLQPFFITPEMLDAKWPTGVGGRIALHSLLHRARLGSPQGCPMKSCRFEQTFVSATTVCKIDLLEVMQQIFEPVSRRHKLHRGWNH